MASVLKVSDAASMGIHAAVLLAGQPERLVSNREIAAALKVSPAHLSKVLQRLSKAGIVRSARGPGGGFRLAKGWENLSLLKVYEAIEGRLNPENCLLHAPICGGKKCIFGGMLKRLNKEVRSYLANNRLADLAGAFRRRK
ncbi:MAG: Rrf2 family transcriptional regulator [Planctomycetota bacterium]